MLSRYSLCTLLLIFSTWLFNPLYAQVQIDTTLTPEQLVQEVLLGNGVSVSNITFNGQPGNILNTQAANYIGPSSFIAFDQGVVLNTGHAYEIQEGSFFPPPPNPNVTDDPDLMQISGEEVNNCAILEFDFVPNGDSLVFRYVFASNEYPSFTCSDYNDAFGFFISGPGINGPYSNNAVNLAVVPGTDIPVSINTINSGEASFSGNEPNCENANPNWVADSIYFVANPTEPLDDIQFPGMTVTLTAYANVQCGETYHIKLAIGDASDGALDSGVFLEAGSFTSNSAVQVNLDIPVGVADSTLYESCGQATLQFIRPSENSNIEETAYLEITGSAINGVDFVPTLPDSVVFPEGIDTVNFAITAPDDANFEGEEFVNILITNVASDCSGAVVTSNFKFYIKEASPLTISGFDGALVDCNDEIELYPTISGGYGEYGYSWSNGQSTDTITVSPGQSTTYFLVVSDTCGVNSQQTNFDVEVPVYPPIEVDLGDDFEVIQCDVTIELTPQVSGGFGLYQYAWTGNGDLVSTAPSLAYLLEETSTIQLVVTDDCQATGSDEVLVSIPEVAVTAYLPDIYVAESCLEDIMLPVIADGGIGQKTYTWTVDGEEITSNSLNYFMYNPAMGQNVAITATDECQNSATDSTFIPFDFPEVEIVTSPDTTICKDTPVALSVDIRAGSGSYHIDWGDSDSSIYMVQPEGNQIFTVTVTDTCGMKASHTINVMTRNVRADFDYEYVSFYGLALTNYSHAVNPTYLWDFGDETTSTETDPRHLYTDLVPYQIVLTTTDDLGCQDTARLHTIPPMQLFIPTAFTPNGDGINDLFHVVGSNLTEYEIKIFDRWGNLVFQSKDVNKKWNGSHHGNGYQQGAEVYNYLIKYKGVKEEDAIKRTGTITVIR